MGSHHSLTPCAASDGTIVRMSKMTRVVKIDRARGTISAEAGLQYIDAAKALGREDLQFMLNIEIGNMTLGSAACCHTKDALDGIEFGQVCSYVTGMKWVTPDGDSGGGDGRQRPGSAPAHALQLRAVRHRLRSDVAGETDRGGAVHVSAAAGG
jgi:FAD/FMN-containing dehydrogenase